MHRFVHEASGMRICITGARQSVVDRAAGWQLASGNHSLAIFHTAATEWWRLPVPQLRRAQLLAEQNPGHPPTFVDNGGILLGFVWGQREWNYVPAQRSRPRGLRQSP